jgi:hypothetical protein
MPFKNIRVGTGMGKYSQLQYKDPLPNPFPNLKNAEVNAF